VIERSAEFAGRVCANGFPLGSSATIRFLSARISFVFPVLSPTAIICFLASYQSVPV
jgi:hypothetical protein